MPISQPRTSRRSRTVMVGLAVAALLAAVAASTTTATWATGPSGAVPSVASSSKMHATASVGPTPNPLADRAWGVYAGPGDQAWVAWSQQPEGETKDLLSKIVLRPKSKWYGQWIPTAQVRETVADNIAVAQAGDPETLVQLTLFRLKPWEEEACKRVPTGQEVADYKAWTDEVVAGIGTAHAAVVLQPDGPFALCAPGGSRVPSKLIRYAAKKLGALPNTSTYIDAGASDWLRNDTAKALKILLPAGVAKVRGFSLNNTHYAATEDEVAFGAAVVKALAKRGVKGKHFVVNTASNGRPFDGFTYQGNNYDNAKTCKTRQQRRCVTLGIPPTADVGNAAWGLPTKVARLARKYADGYLWVGRPWLYMQADPFVMERALDVARTTPY